VNLGRWPAPRSQHADASYAAEAPGISDSVIDAGLASTLASDYAGGTNYTG